MLYRFLTRLLFLGFLTASESSCSLTNIKTIYENDIERKELDKKIISEIKQHKHIAIIGLGGTGKSHLAHHFATTHLSNPYQIIWWIDCHKDIYSQIHHLIKKLNKNIKREKLQEDASSPDILLEEVKKYATQHKLKILLIFDTLTSLDQIESLIFPIQKNAFDFIITSRFDFGLPSTLKVGPFLREQSLEYLKKKLPHLSPEELTELASVLKDYPLSLSQSAYFLEHHHKIMSSAEYVHLYQKNLKSLWERQEKFLSQYKENLTSVQSTLRLSLDHLKTNKKLARYMLIFFSLLENQSIPIEFMYTVFKNVGFQVKESQNVLLELGLYSYIDIVPQKKTKKGYVSLHEIIQQAVLTQEDRGSIQKVAGAISNAIMSSLWQNRYKLITYANENSNLVDHFLHFIKTEEELNLSDLSSALDIKVYLLDYLLYVKRDHQQALQLIDKIEPYVSRISDINLKARFLSSAGDVISLHREGTEQKTQFLNTMTTMVNGMLEELDPHEVVRLNNTIGQIYLLESNPQAAKRFISHSLELIKEFKEPEAIIPTYYFATWMNNELGNYQDAIELAHKAINLFSKVSDTAIKFYVYNCLSLALLRLKKFEESKKFAELSIEKCKKYFGKYQSDTLAEAFSFKAEAELNLGHVSQALKDINQAISIHNMFYKGSYKIIDQAYSTLVKGDCLLMQNNFKEAHTFYLKAFDILEHLQISKKSSLSKRILKRLLYTSAKIEKRNIFEFYKNLYIENFGSDTSMNFFTTSKLLDKKRILSS